MTVPEACRPSGMTKPSAWRAFLWPALTKSAVRHLPDLPDMDDRPDHCPFTGNVSYGHRHSGYILTAVERKSGFPMAAFGRTRHVECLSSCLKGLSCVPAPYRHTLTCGRGKEFLGFRQVNEALQGKRCSRHPGCLGERALHEQGNGLLRRFFPRRRDFSRLTNKETARAVALINHRPGKRSGHLSTAGQPQEKGILLAVCGKKCLCRPATKNAPLPFNAAILPAPIRRRRRSRHRRKDWRRFRQGGPGGRLPACAGGCPGAGCIQSRRCVPDSGRR